MDDSLLERLVVPVADESDTEHTCEGIAPHLPETSERLVIVHVIEKAGGYMDKAPLEARKEQADRVFDIGSEFFKDRSGFETELRYGTDVIKEILAVATEIDATAIAFTPREANRLTRLLSGDEEHRLITESDIPVVAFPESEDGFRKVGES